MKKKNILFIFALVLFACVSGCELYNPIIDDWWKGTEASRDIDGDGGYTYLYDAYIVSFDAGRGSYVDLISPVKGNNPPNQRVLADTPATVPGLVERDGYYFNGWYIGGSTLWNFDDPVTAARVDAEGFLYLHAGWESTGYTIKFNTNHPGGQWAAGELTYIPKDEKIADGAKVAEPLHFGLTSKANYIFNGWYKDQACTDAWVFDTDVANEAADNYSTFADDNVITLYAGWAEISVDVQPQDVYTIVFKSGTNSSPPDQYVEKTKTLIAPYVVQRDGYSFGGWYQDPECTDMWVFNVTLADETADTYGGTADDNIITLYAKWAPVDPVDIFKDLHVVSINYILFAGGGTGFNGPPIPSTGTSLTTNEKRTNDNIITIVKGGLEADPIYRVMVVGHANPVTDEDKANPMNDELVRVSRDRATAVKDKLESLLDPPYDLTKTPIIPRYEGGRMAMRDSTLSRRVEIIIFEVITETVTP